MAHPKVTEAAVIGLPHERWGERPLACVVAADPADPPTKEEIHAHLEGHMPTWWLPDDVVVIDEVPKTSVGKFSKKTLPRAVRGARVLHLTGGAGGARRTPPF